MVSPALPRAPAGWDGAKDTGRTAECLHRTKRIKHGEDSLLCPRITKTGLRGRFALPGHSCEAWLPVPQHRPPAHRATFARSSGPLEARHSALMEQLMCQMGAGMGAPSGNLPPRAFLLSPEQSRPTRQTRPRRPTRQPSAGVSDATAYPVKLAWTGPCACDISRRFRQVQQAPGAHSGVRRAAQ